MAGSHIQKNGYTTIHAMMKAVVSDMIAAGFDLVYPANVTDLNTAGGNYDFDLLGAATTKARWCAILEANSADVNAKSADVWCIKFEWDVNATKDGILDIILGTPNQFDYTTGKHTYYTAKYMSSQKRAIVSGDPTKIDKAYDYKEVLGLLGTSFRNSDALINYPDFIVRGSKSSISSVGTGPAGGSNPDYPNGETDVVVNYRVLDADLLAKFGQISVDNVFSNFASLLGTAGGASSAKVAYKSDLDIAGTSRFEKDTYVKYQSNTYKFLSDVTNFSNVSITTKAESAVFDSGIPASVINKKYLIDGKLYKTTEATTTNTSISPAPTSLNYYQVNNKWFQTSTQVFKILSSGTSSPYWTSGGGNSIAYEKLIAFPSDTVITSENAASFGIVEYYSKSQAIQRPVIADLFNLVYIQDLASGNLTPTTAPLFGMEAVASALAPVYIYEAIADRLYQIVSLVDTATTEITPVTTFPTSKADSFVHGAYNLSYIGKYSDFTGSKSVGSSYYDTFEAEDVDGFDTRLVDGDFSYPAIRRNRNRSSKMFFNREFVNLNESAAFPLAYSLTVTNRGFVLAVNEETSDDVGNRNSWVVVQRPVDHVSGSVYVAGKAPVHCMYSIMSKQPNKPWLHQDLLRGVVDYGYTVKKGISTTDGVDLIKNDTYSIYVPAPEAVIVRRFIVRETDVTAPYPTHVYSKNAYGVNLDYANGGFPFGVPADEHTPDYAAVINTKQQVAISEGNKYVITFPNGFNTARYAYTHEMDMIAYTSADVISSGTEIEITAYGETRTYIALQSNGPNNSGMRILVLKHGGGIV